MPWARQPFGVSKPLSQAAVLAELCTQDVEAVPREIEHLAVEHLGL